MAEDRLRKNVNKITKIIYESLPEGIRPIRRLGARREDQGANTQVHKDMHKFGLEEEDARERERWRRIVGEAKFQLGYKCPW